MSATQERARRPVNAGGQTNRGREARQTGGPTTKINWDGEAGPRRRPQCGKQGMPGHAGGPLPTTYMITEAGPRRRPDESQTGSLSKREAHDINQRGRGGRSTPEARACM